MIIGKKAYEFRAQAVINNEIKDISLGQFGDSYKVIFFYPFNFSAVCPTELRAFQERMSEFHDRNAVVMGVSVDSVFSHQAWLSMPAEKGGIQGIEFPLVSDINKTISKEYEVLNEYEGVAYRGLFILDKHNIVQSVYINNLSIGRSVDEVIRLLDGLIFTQQNKGQMCPANWMQGDKTVSL
jgi:peroxiredoxin (alkyl hydroperoxide reductase subunit C)